MRWKRYEAKHGPVHAPWWDRNQMALLLSLFVSANGGRGDVEQFLPPWVPRARDLKGPPTDEEILAAFASWEK